MDAVDDVVDVQDEGIDAGEVTDAAEDNVDATDAAVAPDDAAQDESTGEDDASGDDASAEDGKEQVGADGRRMPDSLKKALAAVKATSPEAAKELRGLYFANQEYRNAFPTVADAAKAKEIIEEIGGPEGVQEIAAEREEWSNIDRQYAEGDPNFIKGIADSNPDAFVKIAPHAINEWAARAPEQYAYFAQSLTVNMLKNAGIPDKLAAAYEQAKDNPQLQAVIAGVYNSIVDMHERAQQFALKRNDPREERLTQREREFEEQRRASFEEGIAEKAESYLSEKMSAAIKAVAGSRVIDAEALPQYQKLVKEEVDRRLADVPGIAEKLEAFYRTGDAKKSLEYVKAQYNRILPEAAKVIAPLLRSLGPAPVQKSKPPANGTAPVRGEVTLREMPEWKDIDFSKCTTADVASGWAILKNGKKASGWM